MKRSLYYLTLVLLSLAAAGASFAANTPWWWNNPTHITNHFRVVESGSAFNNTIHPPGEAHQAQLVTVIVDVPNLQDPALSKDIWAQVEWTITGSGAFDMSATGVPLWWSLEPGGCPASPLDPFPAVNFGTGFMVHEMAMTPLHGFNHGNEFSYRITPQPPCERIHFHFIVGPNSRVDYRIEIQTVCLGMDFGDAPDNPQMATDYPTLLISDGARHYISPGLVIGTLIDPEADGQPLLNAAGDDMDSDGDDEDGVSTTLQLLVGQAPVITLPILAPSGVTYYLSGWIDLNGDGDWSDPGEFATTIGLGNGLTPVNATLAFSGVPATPIPLTYARFRLASDRTAVQFPTGVAHDGEVEDHPVTVNDLEEETDWGDAPDPLYPTLAVHNGAHHVIMTGLYMGYDIDGETDGSPSFDAQGDDVGDGRDDEDGIDPAQLIFTENQSRAIAVQVHTPAAMTVYVTGWADYDGNGAWEASEQAPIQAWSGSGSGQVTLTFPVVPPGSALITNGQSFARFRLSTDRNALLLPTGAAPDGEVEDYRVTILVPVELSLFTAALENNAVRLNWTTQSETQNLGFHIYRSENSAGEYARITSALIPGAGTSEKVHHYQYSDGSIEPGKTYFYKLADIDFYGNTTYHGPVSVQSAPKSYGLDQNYPNPFNPQTTISFQIKEAAEVQLEIYNVRGQKVRSLLSRSVSPGSYTSVWDGRDDAGQLMPSGTYLYKLRSPGFEESRKMELLK